MGDDGPLGGPAPRGPQDHAPRPPRPRSGSDDAGSYGSGSYGSGSYDPHGYGSDSYGDASYRDSAYGDGSHKDGAYDADAPGSGASAAGSAPATTGGRAAARAQASRSSRRRGGLRKQRTGIHRFLKIAAISLSVLVLATAGVGYWFYQHLNGNITSVPLIDGAGDAPATRRPTPSAATPINILVIGSDTRDNAADCAGRRLSAACSRATRTSRWCCTSPPTAATPP